METMNKANQQRLKLALAIAGAITAIAVWISMFIALFHFIVKFW